MQNNRYYYIYWFKKYVISSKTILYLKSVRLSTVYFKKSLNLLICIKKSCLTKLHTSYFILLMAKIKYLKSKLRIIFSYDTL